MLKHSTEDDVERLENIKELVTIAEKYNHLSGEEGLHSLISEATLVSDQDTLGQAKTGVKIMTIHASKGLEFDTVFVTGLEQGLFPHQGLPGSDENRDDEEERRLCYVAVTRAGRKLFLTYAQTRMIFGSRQVNMPSEFILDLPDDLVEAETDMNDTYEVTNYLDF
jgi:DNA helicase II / ATP-dependent DNA helicase PcrA